MIENILTLPEEKRLDYQEQSVEKLILTLVDDDIDLSQFKILKEGWIDNNDLIIQAGIIGTSHFVKINHDGGVIYEVLSCTEVESSAKKLYDNPLSSIVEISRVDIENDYMSYSFCPEIKKWDDGKMLMDELEGECQNSNNNQISLSHDFAGFNECHPPKTLLNLCLDKKGLRLRTVHAYPNEKLIVFTNSTVTFI